MQFAVTATSTDCAYIPPRRTPSWSPSTPGAEGITGFNGAELAHFFSGTGSPDAFRDWLWKRIAVLTYLPFLSMPGFLCGIMRAGLVFVAA